LKALGPLDDTAVAGVLCDLTAAIPYKTGGMEWVKKPVESVEEKDI